jgi:hypothetical protein
MSTKCNENGCQLDLGDDEDTYKGADASNDREEADAAREAVKDVKQEFDIPTSEGFINTSQK